MNTEIYNKIEDFLVSKLNPSYIIVFGSQAKDTARKDSDLDVAFYKEDQNISSYETFLLAQDLADIIKIDVDLIDLQKASTVFKAQIYSTGNVIFSKDDTLLKIHQMTALSMYAKLNEEREPILKHINESGSIYGK
ncbi:putative nucleotidyltransferase [Scopulibacillus darangshiensis]|uniref:Putative nucleotidyltransferase n=1 Tax=Scopulibacillus darangshiensis TaxID=442528 RepID=A0A4R2NQW8_9BACL|nr:nucleotidyltransferase domain-containing protein [Scopulibacillus darangshiensis]TCP23778.1 putative nucleotidyltransferase [Scopulibacillus darangshiensis]